MHIDAFLAAFLFLTSAASAYLWTTRLPLPPEPGLQALSFLVLWQLLQLLPVQLLAALQVAGLVGRVTIAALAGLQVVWLAVSLLWTATHRVAPASAPGFMVTHPVWPRYLVAAAVVLVGSYVIFAIDIFSSFPSGSDAIAYHLPVALRWLQTGSLAIPASKAWRFSLPGNAEIGMMILLATGKESAVVLVNWTALAVLAISTYLLAKRISHGDRLVAATATLLLLSIPMFEFQALSAYVDLFGTAFLVAAFTLFVYLKPNGNTPGTASCRWLVFLSAAACGISLGTKPIYDLYAAAYAVFVLFSLYRDRDRKQTIVIQTALLVAGLLLPSVFWFGRATAATGNPVFPMRVAVGNHVVLAGYASSQITNPDFDLNFVRSRAEWPIYPWTEWKRDPGYLMIPYGEGSGVGALFASLVPVGLAFLLFRAFREFARNSGDSMLLLALALSLVAWWFFLSRVPRFALPIVVLACVLTAPLIEVLQRHQERPFAFLFLVSLLITCTISSFVPFHMLVSRLRSGRWARSDFYSYPRLLDQLPAGSCVMNYTQLEEKNFALAGKGLRNCVVPAFEIPSPITREFLQQHHVDFVAEIVPHHEDTLAHPAIAGMSLMSDQLVKSGEDNVQWRVWRVEQTDPEPPSR